MLEPEDCRSIAEIRAGVDALDEEIVTLLAKRMRFMDAAAHIKQHRDQVRDEGRKTAVIANVLEAAREVGLPPELVRALYETLIEASIAYEYERFDAG